MSHTMQNWIQTWYELTRLWLKMSDLAGIILLLIHYQKKWWRARFLTREIFPFLNFSRTAIKFWKTQRSWNNCLLNTMLTLIDHSRPLEVQGLQRVSWHWLPIIAGLRMSVYMMDLEKSGVIVLPPIWWKRISHIRINHKYNRLTCHYMLSADCIKLI